MIGLGSDKNIAYRRHEFLKKGKPKRNVKIANKREWVEKKNIENWRHRVMWVLLNLCWTWPACVHRNPLNLAKCGPPSNIKYERNTFDKNMHFEYRPTLHCWRCPKVPFRQFSPWLTWKNLWYHCSHYIDFVVSQMSNVQNQSAAQDYRSMCVWTWPSLSSPPPWWRLTGSPITGKTFLKS